MIILLTFIAAVFSSSPFALAQQQSLLPGEPDPNTGPRATHPEARGCPAGQRRYQKLKCSLPDDKRPDCANVTPVMVCRPKPVKLRCKQPKVSTPVYVCG